MVYKWCWIISSDFHRQYARGDHSQLPAIFLFIIAMHDKHLVHETAKLSILDCNVDFESHAIIESPPHNHQHTTGTVPQHFQCFDLSSYSMIHIVTQSYVSSGCQHFICLYDFVYILILCENTDSYLPCVFFSLPVH